MKQFYKNYHLTTTFMAPHIGKLCLREIQVKSDGKILCQRIFSRRKLHEKASNEFIIECYLYSSLIKLLSRTLTTHSTFLTTFVAQKTSPANVFLMSIFLIPL